MAAHTPWLELPSSVLAAPLLHRGRLIVGTIDGGVHAVDPASGTPIWSARVKGTSVQGLAANDDLVIATVQWGGVSSGRGIAFAVGVESGAIRWERRADAAIGTPPCLTPGAVLFGTQTTGLKPRDGTLFALAPATGEVLWTRPVPAFEHALVVVNDALLGAAGEGALVCVDLASGAPRWRVATEKFFTGPPAIADGVVYLGGQDGVLRAIGLGDGSERWRVRRRHPWVATPLVSDGLVHAGSWDESQYALAADDGRVVWQRELGAMAAAPPVALGRGVLLGCHDESVHLLDRDTGAPVWVWRGPGGPWDSGVLAPPLPLGERVILLTKPGRLYMVDAATGQGLPPQASARPLRVVGTPKPGKRRSASRWEERRLGMLAVPSQRLVACDPISDPHSRALDRTIPPGPHAVFVGLHANGAETVVSWLELRIGDGHVSEWRAPRRGPRAVGVDSARVALLDRNAAERLAADAECADRLEGLYTEIDPDTGAGLWTLACVASERAPDVAACVAGFGDGEYPVSYGLDERGRLVRVRLTFIATESAATP